MLHVICRRSAAQRTAFALLLLGMTDACCPLFAMQLALVKGKELHWTEYGVGGGTCQSGNCVAEVRLSRLYRFWKHAETCFNNTAQHCTSFCRWHAIRSQTMLAPESGSQRCNATSESVAAQHEPAGRKMTMHMQASHIYHMPNTDL